MARKQDERRKYKRLDLSCSLALLDEEGNKSTTTRTVNLSDGGAFVSLPLDELPPCDAKLKVALSVPRSTPNTFMIEDFVVEGTVLRHQPLRDDRFAGMAVKFTKPMKLHLEV